MRGRPACPETPVYGHAGGLHGQGGLYAAGVGYRGELRFNAPSEHGTAFVSAFPLEGGLAASHGDHAPMPVVVQAGEQGVPSRTAGPRIAPGSRARLPSVFGVKDHVFAGGLMSYAPDTRDLYRQAATYVDKS
jgi:hypothetical protein